MKNMTKKQKIIYSIFGILTILILILSLIGLTKYTFVLLSFLANFFLFIIIGEVTKLLKIKFTKKQILIMISIIVSIYIFYVISILNRNFIYYWDYSCYYNIQLGTAEKFASSFMDGIRYFVGSTWSGEYGNFLSFFPEMIFNFTNKDINSFLLSCVFVYIPYIIVSLSIVLKKCAKLFKIESENKFLIIALLFCILFPILHATFIYGQPDLFGLVFIFLIIALTINYDFKELEEKRLILVLVITFMLVISRRWYLYWIIAYFLCYIIKIILTNLKNKNTLKQIMKNIIIYGIIVIIFFGVTLFPLIKNILISNVGSYSDFYLTGGFISEILSQISHLGYITLTLIILGIIFGLIRKKYRLITILSILQYILIIFLFTRIQNMGLHHSLVLVPTYLYWLYLLVVFIIQSKKINTTRACIIIFSVLLVNFVYGICNNTTDNLFTKVSLTVPKQADYEEIKKVASWLKENINEEKTAYMITHNNKYNPDKFRNFYMPDKTISKYLPYGSAIIGTHKFPTELFTAKYIITTTPFEGISVEQKYNDVFDKIKDDKFKLIKDYDMNNGYHILIYERIRVVDEKERNLYLHALEDVSEKYKELYKNIIIEFKI